jgi:hypothetical protein
LRGARTEVAKCLGSDLQVPANAEIVLEGVIGDQTAQEGPHGDHTGYYNEAERFPVLTVERMTMRRSPLYHTTYTGKPPDEPAVLGMALNEVFVPLLQKQFPEIVDFYLPPEGCSYRLAVVTMRKQYPGHAKRVMFGIWSFLRQFMYTKFIIVCDEDIDARDWKEVVWALTTRVDAVRDTLLVEHTPIDYLDFATTSISQAPSLAWARRWASMRPRSGRARPRANGVGRSSWTRPSSAGSTRYGRRSACSARVHPLEEGVERGLRFAGARMVDHHHYRLALAIAIEHIAGHRACIGEQAGLDVRLAGDGASEQPLAHGAVDRRHRQGRDEFRHHRAAPCRLQQREQRGGAGALVARKARAVLHNELRGADALGFEEILDGG